MTTTTDAVDILPALLSLIFSSNKPPPVFSTTHSTPRIRSTNTDRFSKTSTLAANKRTNSDLYRPCGDDEPRPDRRTDLASAPLFSLGEPPIMCPQVQRPEHVQFNNA